MMFSKSGSLSEISETPAAHVHYVHHYCVAISFVISLTNGSDLQILPSLLKKPSHVRQRKINVAFVK